MKERIRKLEIPFLRLGNSIGPSHAELCAVVVFYAFDSSE